MTTAVLQPDGASGLDTRIHEGSPNNNYGARGDNWVGYQASTTEHKILIAFDLSSIPSNAVLSAATLSLYCANEALSTDVDVDVHRSLVEWYEGDANGGAPSGDGSTWNERNYNGSVAWSGGAGGVAGTEYNATPTDTTTITGAGDAEFTWDVTDDVVGFLNGTYTNYGWWLLVASYVSPNLHKIFWMSEWTTASLRPKLTVEYVVPAGSATGAATAVGTLSATASISGSASGSATVSGTLVSQLLFGSIAGAATAGGTLLGVGAVGGNAAGAATVDGDIVGLADIDGSISGAAAAVGTIDFVNILHGAGAGAAVVTGTMWGMYTAARRVPLHPAPLLYITDGTLQANGQLNRLDLLGQRGGYCLEAWTPALAQYKSGGYFADPPQATGRRLAQRVFANAIEVFVLKLRATSQDEAARYQQELVRWLEAAADYRQSLWASTPVYLVARSAYESNTRYALIEAGSVPELGTNVYDAPFHGRAGAGYATAMIPQLTLRMERGHWTATPPGQSEAVAISSFRSFTVTGWSS